jgi:Kelch motif
LPPLVIEGLAEFNGSFDQLCLKAGTAAIEAMLAADAEQFCGKRYQRHADRSSPLVPGFAVAEVGGKIYVVGGFRGERELVEIYDPATDRWSRGDAIPLALHHAAAAGLNGKLYVIGGSVAPLGGAFIRSGGSTGALISGFNRAEARLTLERHPSGWRYLEQPALANSKMSGKIISLKGRADFR